MNDDIKKGASTALINTNLAMLVLLKELHSINSQHNHTEFGCPICAPYIELSAANRELVVALTNKKSPS